MRITDFLTDNHVPFEILPHAPAYAAQRLAKYLGVSGSEVAKAVLLRGPHGFFLVVLPAVYQVNLAQFGEGVRLATTEEITATFRDCEWGVVSPFGNLYGLPTYLDDSFTPDMWIAVEAGTRDEAVRLSARDFARLSGCERGRFALKDDPPGEPGTQLL